MNTESISHPPSDPLTLLADDWTKALTPSEAADFGEDFSHAIAAIRRGGRASTAVLQEQLQVSYCRAARMLDAMERLGLVPPAVSRKPRARLTGEIEALVNAA
jgi:DNA segregation ATPase FtsK/SpoIIIE-like protein